MDNILILAAAFVLSLSLTGMLRWYALKVHMLDIPNPRSSHSVPVPRGGGLAVVLVFILGALVLSGRERVLTPLLLTLLLPCILVAVAGFLAWNWPPAKIFMGDAGSGFLGMAIGLFALITAAEGGINLWSWLILYGVFVVDATFTLVRRFVRGEKFYQAHRSHAYQILARRYGSHRKVTLLVLLVNICWLFPLAVVPRSVLFLYPLLLVTETDQGRRARHCHAS